MLRSPTGSHGDPRTTGRSAPGAGDRHHPLLPLACHTGGDRRVVACRPGTTSPSLRRRAQGGSAGGPGSQPRGAGVSPVELRTGAAVPLVRISWRQKRQDSHQLKNHSHQQLLSARTVAPQRNPLPEQLPEPGEQCASCSVTTQGKAQSRSADKAQK